MERIALFPGTFDPITLGHLDIIERALPLFDEIIVAIGVNSGKQPMFSLDDRLRWIRTIFRNDFRVRAIFYEGLTVNCCKEVKANFILRGIRYVSDFEYEKAIADANRALADVETVFLTALPGSGFVASTLVRDVIRNKGDVSQFVPSTVLKDINKP